MSTLEERWERFLDPEVVRTELFSALMFITTFEILKDSAVDRIRDFFSIGFDQTGPAVAPEYQEKVLCRSKSPLYASLDWLREQGAIDQTDLALFEELKKIRNKLAHELFAVVTGQTDSEHRPRLDDLLTLLRKIEVWWVVNVEIAINREYDGQEVDEAGIVPGSILGLRMLVQVASGDTTLLEHYRKLKEKGLGDT
jgi:hypothetical protein